MIKCRNVLVHKRKSAAVTVLTPAIKLVYRLLDLNCSLLCVSRMLPAPLMTYQYQRSFIKAASESFTFLPLKVAFRGRD